MFRDTARTDSEVCSESARDGWLWRVVGFCAAASAPYTAGMSLAVAFDSLAAAEVSRRTSTRYSRGGIKRLEAWLASEVTRSGS